MSSRDLFSLGGKTALVTGAAGHLGSAMSIALAEAGAHVILCVRSAEKASSLLESIEELPGTAEILQLDVCDEVAVARYFSVYDPRPLHVLVNNAYHGRGGTIESSAGADYLSSYQIALVAAHEMLRNALPALRAAVRESGDASVINIGSMYGLVSPDKRVYETAQGTNPPFYGAAKAALIHWTRYAACEFGAEGIRVNSISPGPFPSLSVQRDAPEFVAKLNGKVPMGRVGLAREMAAPLVFLASPGASYVTGINVPVDGGWTAW
jgi:NAD(P)-dependent dehydrogenase (short-subunit alcohol dehydrogenase family)